MEQGQGTTPLGGSLIVKCSPDAFYSEVSQEIVLLNVETGQYHSLDAIGGAIWRSLEAGPTVDAACEAMMRFYPGDAAAVRADTLEFLGKLADRGLVSFA